MLESRMNVKAQPGAECLAYGKVEMREYGNVSIPQKAFVAALWFGED